MKINRSILPEIEKQIQNSPDKKRVIILYGPRQVGKTTLVKYLVNQYSQNAEYYNCDYADVRELFAYENIQNIAKQIRNLKILVLDEAQRIQNIGLVLKILVDNFPNLQIIATGSSSFDLSNQINEPLTGRKREYHLFPFAFAEISQNKTVLESKRNLEKLLRFGSYPDIFLASEQETEILLKELTNSYLFKDVFTFQILKKPEMLTKLLRLLAFQIGSEVSFHELAQQLGVDQSVVQKYIHLLEEAFVIFRLGSFNRNLRNEIKKNRKIYFWDLGVRNALIQNFNTLEFRNDIGALWENFFIAERLKYLSNQQKFVNSYFWRTYDQKEIDYLEEADGKLKAFECKWNPQKKVKPPQEFLKTYAESSFEIITPENFEEYLIQNNLRNKLHKIKNFSKIQTLH